MTNILALLVFTFVIVGCSTPKPPRISFTRDLKPINFFDRINDNNIVIKSEQVQNHWNKQFIYSIDDQNPSVEFFYAISHADKIIARVKPPFIDFVFSRIRTNLKNYGVSTQIELSITEDENQDSQVILECIKLIN